jgi:hypothetical protein
MMIFTIGLTIGLRMGLFGNATIEKAIIESNYYEESYRELTSQIDWFMSDSDLPVEVILTDLSLEQFYIDARTQTQRIIRGIETNQLTTLVNEKKQEILESLTYEYEKRNIEISSDLQVKLEETAELASQLYQEQLELGLVKEIINYRDSFETLGIWIMLGALVLGSVIIGLLLKMYRHKHKAIRYLVYSAISASGMLILSVIVMLKHIDYSSILEGKEHYQRLIETYIRESELALLYPAGCGIIISCLLLVLIKELRKRAMGE